MNSGINHNSSLDSIEKALAEEIKGKELWGDISISKDEYEILRDKLKKVLAFKGYSFSHICKFFPCSVTSFLVFLARYKYDINFWGLAGTELDREISLQNEKVLGECAKDTFERYKFDYSDVKGERRVYLEPILFEAGIPPESSLDDLFYIISSNTGDSFDPRLLIDDLQERRAYQIRKPLQKFLSRYGGENSDRAVDYLLEVHDAVYSVEQGMESNSIYIDNYSVWKNEFSEESPKARKEKDNQAKPYLHFENGTKGLCLVLPKTILLDEWVSEAVWTITGTDGYSLSKRMAVFGDGSRRYVESIEVPVRPEEEYTITLTDEDLFESTPQNKWTVPGIDRDGALLFNADGRQINARFIPTPFGILVKGCDAPILECEGLSCATQYYPTNTSEYEIIYIEAESPNAVLKYRSNQFPVSLTLRPQVNLSLSGEALFSRIANRPPYLFTSFPTLLVSADTADFIDGLELRCGSEKKELAGLTSGDSVRISLDELDNGRKNRYGLYSVRLYQNNHFLKQIEFYLVPNISTNYSSVDALIGFSSKKRSYQFTRRKDCELQFQNCVVRSFPEDDTCYSIECAATTGFVPVVFKYTGEDHTFQFSFDLPVNPYQVELLEEDGSRSEEDMTKIGVSELIGSFHCLSIRVANVSSRYSSVLLQLRTSDGIIQSETVRLAENGCGLVNLGAFYDTLRSCPLPARFELSRAGMDISSATIMKVADSVDFQTRPQFNGDFTRFLALSSDGENDIILKRFGRNQAEYHFFAAQSVVGPNKKGVPVRRYPVTDKILPGIYVVEGQRSSDQFEFEAEGSNSLQLTNGKNTIFVTARKKGSEILCVSDWLEQLVQDILSCGSKSSNTLDKSVSYRSLGMLETLPASFSLSDYELMVALAAFRTAKRADNRYRTLLGECMDAVSKQCLSGKHRLELIRCLAEMTCSSEIVLECINRYHLFLFYPGTNDALSLSEAVYQHSPELALLLKMGCDAPIRDTVANSRYLSIIGREALLSLLDISDIPEPEKQNEIRKQFLRERPSPNVSIVLSKDISGDMEPIRKMFVSTAKRNYYDYSKRPDEGLYFGQVRFCDQFLNWYQKNTDRDQNLFEETEQKIQTAFRSYGNAILSGIKKLKKVPQLREMVSHYEKALRGRCDEPEKYNNYCGLEPFFYLEGMAALLSMLPSEYRQYDWAIRPGTEFILKSMEIAPEMARRDILMAGTYLYLKRKESSLCQ